MFDKQEGQREIRVKLNLGIFMQINILKYQVWSWLYTADHLDYNWFRRLKKRNNCNFLDKFECARADEWSQSIQPHLLHDTSVIAMAGLMFLIKSCMCSFFPGYRSWFKNTKRLLPLWLTTPWCAFPFLRYLIALCKDTIIGLIKS